MGKEKKKLKLIVIIIVCMVVIMAIVVFINKKTKPNIKESNVENLNIDEEKEYLSQAKVLEYEKLSNEKSSNIVRAKQEYEGKIFIFTTNVKEIFADYFLASYGPLNNIMIYLKDINELAKLNKNDDIVVVGKLENIENDLKLISAYIITDNPNLIWALTEENYYSTTRKYYDYTYDEEGKITGYKEKGNGYPRYIYVKI